MQRITKNNTDVQRITQIVLGTVHMAYEATQFMTNALCNAVCIQFSAIQFSAVHWSTKKVLVLYCYSKKLYHNTVDYITSKCDQMLQHGK